MQWLYGCSPSTEDLQQFCDVNDFDYLRSDFETDYAYEEYIEDEYIKTEYFFLKDRIEEFCRKHWLVSLEDDWLPENCYETDYSLAEVTLPRMFNDAEDLLDYEFCNCDIETVTAEGKLLCFNYGRREDKYCAIKKSVFDVFMDNFTSMVSLGDKYEETTAYGKQVWQTEEEYEENLQEIFDNLKEHKKLIDPLINLEFDLDEEDEMCGVDADVQDWIVKAFLEESATEIEGVI